ncbi:MAG: ComEC/Rec2 family competence protein [Candidatus Omnitrophota bacterium]
MSNKDNFLQTAVALHKRPFFIMAAFFCLGIIIASFRALPFYILFPAACFLLFLCLLFFSKQFWFNMFVGIFFLLAGMISFVNYNLLPNNHYVYNTPFCKTHAYLIGTIITDPENETVLFSSNKTSFRVKAQYLKTDEEWIRTSGVILVHLYDSSLSFAYADRVVIEGDIARVNPPSNPGQFDYKKYLESEQIYAVFNSYKNDFALKIGAKKISFIKRYAFLLRDKCRRKIENHISSPQREILSGVLLGLRKNFPPEIENIFVKTGTMHVLPAQSTKLYPVAFSDQIAL